MFHHRLTLSLAAFCILGQSAAFAQGSMYRAPSSFAGKIAVLPIGTTFEGRMQHTIGSRHSRSGETFAVELSAPFMANGNTVIIPSGSEIVGEVAEAIPSSAQPHDKNRTPPLGILRVQLTSIHFPDGQSYPLVASFAADGSRSRSQTGLNARKSSVAYIGTQAGFDAVNPALQPAKRSQGRMQVMKKNDIMSDPIYGDSNQMPIASGSQIRALVRQGRELVILQGSSMTIRLDSPLTIALGSSSVQAGMEAQPPAMDNPMPSGKHFSKNKPAPQTNQQPGQAAIEEEAHGQGRPPAQAGGYPPQQGGYPPQQGGQQPPAEQPGSSF